jgi:uncharacterized protein (TIGR00369 family)
MKRLNPDYIERLKGLAAVSPFFQLLSIDIDDFSPGSSVVRVGLSEKHIQVFGVAHGGVYATMIDAAVFFAIYASGDEESSVMTTVDLYVNFLAPASTGVITARGKQKKLGRNLGYGIAEVTDEEGKILAHGTSTVMILPGKSLPVDPPMPPKFLQ